VGSANVGKSTLLNRLVGAHIAPVTHKRQTTRRRLHGVQTLECGQIIWVDTPGFCSGGSVLQRAMRRIAPQAMEECHATVLMLAGVQEWTTIERRMLARPDLIVAINKVDLVHPKERLLPVLTDLGALANVAAVVPISAKTGRGVQRLVDEVVARLPECEPLVDPGLTADVSERALCEELIREQVLLQVHDEVPYGVAISILSFDDERPAGMVRIEGELIVEQEGQKGIVIGANAARLKSIGTKARAILEELLGAQVFLHLHVRVDQDWTLDRNKVQDALRGTHA
jgi:GTP-binding protein Era